MQKTALPRWYADNVYAGFGNSPAAPDVRWGWNTAQTVDAFFLGLSDAQNVFLIAENGDRAFDFAHGVQTNPTLFIHSAAQNTTQWLSFAHNQTNSVINWGTGALLLTGGATILGSGEAGITAATGNTFRAPDITTGGVGNIAGADLTIAAGLGTGTGDEGTIIFQLPIQAGAGDIIQTRATRMTLDMDSSGTELSMLLPQTLTIVASAGIIRVDGADGVVLRDSGTTALSATSDGTTATWSASASDHITIAPTTSGNLTLNATGTTTTVILQNRTITPGAGYVAVQIPVTFAEENFSHGGLEITATQNGANSSALQGLRVALTKATGATTLAGLQGIVIDSPTITGVDSIVTRNTALLIADQNIAGIGSGTAINLEGTGANNSITLGDSAMIYGSAAEVIRFDDSTATRGITFTMTAAANQTIAATGGELVLNTATNLGVATSSLGILRFNGNTSGTVTVQSAAAAGTWTMTLPTTNGDASQFLQTDGAGITSWATVTVPTGSNPTAEVSLAVVNGVATTFMRSDAAPPLSQAITPTWTGAHIWSGSGLRMTVTSTQDAASTQVAILQGDRATITDADTAYLSLQLSDSAGNQDEQARISWSATTVLSGATQDGDLIFSALVNNALTEMFRLDGSADVLDASRNLTWGTGTAVTAGAYSIGRDADGTNQMHSNVPTGAGWEWSVNDVSQMTLTASALLPAGTSKNVGGNGALWASVRTALVQPNDNGSSLQLDIPVSGADASLHSVRLTVDSNNILVASATGNGAGGIITPAVTIGQFTIATGGASHNLINVNPTWATEAFTHRAMLINSVQDGANSSEHIGLAFNLEHTSAGELGTQVSIDVPAPSIVAGSIATNYVMRIGDQTNVNITTPRGINFTTAGVANSIVWGGSAIQYASAAQTVSFFDSTNTAGINLVLTAAGPQTISPTLGALEIDATSFGVNSQALAADNTDAGITITAGDGVNVDNYMFLNDESASRLVMQFKTNPTDPTDLAEAGYTEMLGITSGGTMFIANNSSASISTTDMIMSVAPTNTRINLFAQTIFYTYRSGATITSDVDSRYYAGFLSHSTNTDTTPGTSVKMVGFAGTPERSASSGTIPGLTSFLSRPRNITAGSTVTDAIHYEVENALATGPITNQYGLYIANLTSGGSDYGIYIAGADTLAIWVDAGTTRLDGDVDLGSGGGARLYGGGLQYNKQDLAANTNLTLDENDGVVNVTTGAVSDNTVTLPAASGNEGQIISVYLVTDAGTNVVVTRAGADVIQNGSADLANTTVTLDDAGDFVMLQCVNSTMWQVLVNSGGAVA